MLPAESASMLGEGYLGLPPELELRFTALNGMFCSELETKKRRWLEFSSRISLGSLLFSLD